MTDGNLSSAFEIVNTGIKMILPTRCKIFAGKARKKIYF